MAEGGIGVARDVAGSGIGVARDVAGSALTQFLALRANGAPRSPTPPTDRRRHARADAPAPPPARRRHLRRGAAAPAAAPASRPTRRRPTRGTDSPPPTRCRSPTTTSCRRRRWSSGSTASTASRSTRSVATRPSTAAATRSWARSRSSPDVVKRAGRRRRPTSRVSSSSPALARAELAAMRGGDAVAGARGVARAARRRLPRPARARRRAASSSAPSTTSMHRLRRGRSSRPLRSGARLGVITDLFVEEEARAVGVGEAMVNDLVDALPSARLHRDRRHRAARPPCHQELLRDPRLHRPRARDAPAPRPVGE